MKEKKHTGRTQLYWPRSERKLQEDIQKAADSEKRSFNALVRMLCQEAIDARTQKQIINE